MVEYQHHYAVGGGSNGSDGQAGSLSGQATGGAGGSEAAVMVETVVL